MRIHDLPEENLFTAGHTMCPGCGAAIAVRNIMKILGRNTIIYNPACCLLVCSTTYPLISWKVPFHHVAFENTGACITGIRRALKKQGKDDVIVAGIAGDGGTFDIGLQALSGAAERNEDVIYMCYDNEAYMNTGIQRSGASPFHAWTTTTPIGKEGHGNITFKKDIPSIIAAHNVPYVATASIGYPLDFMKKIEKAKNIKGFRYIQIFAPCPTGWKFDASKSVQLAKLAVEVGIYPILEIENGVRKVTIKPKEIPINDEQLKKYFRLQGRFSHITDEERKQVRDYFDNRWKQLQVDSR